MNSPRVVLVTGASSGFGAALARRFALSGDRVIAAAPRRARLEALARELGDAVVPLELDVRTSAQAIERALASLPSEVQAIDVLVNNAGLALGIGGAHEADFADWSAMIATNCSG